MPVLQIEHPVRDFDAWKAAFDSDPAGREAGGVRGYSIYRPVDDANFVEIDLAFDSLAEAQSFWAGLEAMWQTPRAAAALGGTPRVRIVDEAESRQY
jgi:hypothetical protein